MNTVRQKDTNSAQWATKCFYNDLDVQTNGQDRSIWSISLSM